MKIRLTFKNPDAVHDAIWDVDDAALLAGQDYDTADPADVSSAVFAGREELREKLKKWVYWGEYLTVLIDTDADTATVVRPK